MSEYNIFGLLIINILISLTITLPLCFALRRIVLSKAYRTKKASDIRKRFKQYRFLDRLSLLFWASRYARHDVKDMLFLYYAYLVFNIFVFSLSMRIPLYRAYMFLMQSLVNLLVGIIYLKYFH